MTSLPKVAVAMSGGVDSSVAAALLVEQGYPVIGLMLRLWSEPGREDQNRCCTPDAMAQARRVASILGIPFFVIDSRERFHDTVVRAFLEGHAAGNTPNPCITCNRMIRWGVLLEHSLALGAEKMATGHYARLKTRPDGKIQLLKGLDSRKDQAYVLSQLSQDQLRHSLLPVGEFEKPAIRELAVKFGLPVAARRDSQDLCFLAGQDYRDFIKHYAPHLLRAGPIRNRLGQILGQHEGLAFYTIGQRKGLGVASLEPLFVIEKDASSNALIIGPTSELGSNGLITGKVNWISGVVPESGFLADVKIRYKAEPAQGYVELISPDRVQVTFAKPLRDITPGQLAVFYNQDVVLGGGLIQTVIRKGPE